MLLGEILQISQLQLKQISSFSSGNKHYSFTYTTPNNKNIYAKCFVKKKQLNLLV